VTQNQARRIIHQAFIDEWDPPAPAVPYSFDNERLETENLDAWVRLTIRNQVGGQWTLGPVGSRVYRRRGAVVVEVHSTVDRGLLRLDELTKAALDLYEGRNLEQVMFNDGTILELSPNGRWARGNVVVNFTYDETK